MLTCLSCGQENPEGFRFCGNCGAPLAGAAPPREQRKVVTALFCDVADSTALGEALDPEALRALLARYFERMKAIVDRHGGTVEKFVGDAVMAVFGVPQLHEDDALRAVRAAAEMRQALPQLGVEARIGLNTGEVVVGTAERLATGDAVNVAARLQQAAGPGEILLGPETLRLVRAAIEAEPTDPLKLKGKHERVIAHRLIRVLAEAPGFAGRLEAPLVGRERQLRRLQVAYEQVVADCSCQLFTLLGAAGVGKSRLAAAFLHSPTEATIVRGRCLSYGEGITYWPVVEVLKQLPAAAELGLAPAVSEAIEGLLGEEPLVSSSEEIAWAVRKLLETTAETSPLIVLFDDVHWGEPTFLGLVEHVADLSRGAPLLLLCLARPELLERRPGWGAGTLNATTFLLEPLSCEETDTMLERLLGKLAMEHDLRKRISEAAEGNPLFIEEMVALVQESGDGEVSVPPTIQALLAARLDQLDPNERGTLECGAVEGRVFHRGAVQALAPEDTQVGARLTALVRKELVRPDKAQLPGEEAYRFRHLLLRDSAYDALPKATRAELHERFAAWLDGHGAKLVELDEIVGYHLEQANRYRVELGLVDAASHSIALRAAERLASSGRRAFARGDLHATVSLFERAATLLEQTDDARPRVLLELGEALTQAGAFARARDVLTEAAAQAEAAGDRALQASALLEAAAARAPVDPAFAGESLRRLASETIRELETTSDARALAKSFAVLGHAYLVEAQGQRMEEALERSIEYAQRAGDRRQESDALMWLCRLAWFGPLPTALGLRRCTEIAEAAKGEPALESVAIQALGIVNGMRGEFDRARELLARARQIQLELGMRLQAAAGGSMMAGLVESLAGDHAAAENHWRWGYNVLDELGEKGYLSTVAGYLAGAIYEQGRYADAERMAQSGRDAAATDDLSTQILWRGVMAKVFARRGQLERAEALAREAVALAEASDFSQQHGDALLCLAEVLRLARRDEEARPLGEDALDIFERKGDLASARKSRALLAQVEP